jgi:hypothetical protein
MNSAPIRYVPQQAHKQYMLCCCFPFLFPFSPLPSIRRKKKNRALHGAQLVSYILIFYDGGKPNATKSYLRIRDLVPVRHTWWWGL